MTAAQGHNNNNNNSNSIPPLLKVKLVILALMGFSALLLAGAVWTLQLQINLQHRQQQQPYSKDDNNNDRRKGGGDGNTPAFRTIQSSQPTTFQRIHLSKHYPPPEGSSLKTSAEAYWNHVAYFLQEWDVVEEDMNMYTMGTTGTTGTTDTKDWRIPQNHNHNNHNSTTYYPRWALEQAAHNGHPLAQHYLALSYVSGIWPTKLQDPLSTPLTVLEEWNTHGGAQITKAFLLWHMAAMGGNVEAAMALAYRLGTTTTTTTSKGGGGGGTCTDVLPYYEAAANGIMDQLEALPLRTKVAPHMDKHVLAQVHMHGGTSSQLDWNNKPDESKEALQFYHLKATTVPWSAYSTSTTDSNNKTAANTIDVHAAYTLGHLYHYGMRGVPQNLTLSLEYYEIAATHGHWESAGMAGMAHFWGMGVPRNPNEAWTFFQLGAPQGLNACRRKHDLALQQQQQNPAEEVFQEQPIVECDDQSLNGWGLLHLFGIEGKLEVDLVMAEKYFTLAKEMGNMDAHYHLAMIWLGWKTHFKKVDDLTHDGMSHTSDISFGGATSNNNNNKAYNKAYNNNHNNHMKTPPNYALHISKKDGETLFKGPNQSDIQDAIKVLTIAANKGHLQAKHRLGMIYSHGIRVQTAALKYDAVKKDCQKAKSQYEYIVNNASPVRSKRLRKAYQDYMHGDLEASLRNYLAASETGSTVAQVNAAFLLERGTCLGLSPADCAKASVRLWKAAAARGNAEACLRVGDFYYYGRLRANEFPVGPLRWVQYLLYPEEYLPKLFQIIWKDKFSKDMFGFLARFIQRFMGNTKTSISESVASANERNEEQDTKTCQGDEEVCHAGDDDTDDNTNGIAPTTTEEDEQARRQHEQEIVHADMAMAGHYYLVAAEKHYSPRANFNLGFMHEWGLGLKQDFPLAKRHYDLAISGQSNEAELTIKVARITMTAHQYFVKWHSKRKGDNRNTQTKAQAQEDVLNPSPADTLKVGQPVPGGELPQKNVKTPMDVIISHLFDWKSLVIAALLYILWQLNAIRHRQRRH